MRICIDLDNTICYVREKCQTYKEIKPKIGVIEKLQKWHSQGHYIIIYTARHMLTCEGDVKEIIKRVGDMTESWLLKWDIPYSELIFGKPYADVYIDDKALKFEDNWNTIELPTIEVQS